MNDREKLTQKVLLSISSHLSNNPIYKKDEFKVAIGCLGFDMTRQMVIGEIGDESYFQSTIYMDPYCTVFPDRYHRRPEDKENVIRHVLVNHFPELWKGVDAYGTLQIDTEKLVPGTYIYKRSFSGKRRSWVHFRLITDWNR